MQARSPQRALLENLSAISDWMEAHTPLPEFTNTVQFVEFSVEVMSRTLYLLKVGVALVPNEKMQAGVPRNKAIVLGHLVRLMKLYDCFILHACKDQLEICMIFFRIILETTVRIEYLIRAKQSTFRHFVLISYRPEKEHIADLKRKAKQRPLIPIEQRILRSVNNHLKGDGLTQKALLQNKSWELDGKNFRALLKNIGHDDGGYSYGFGNASHFLHGDWRDLTMHHLERNGRNYNPKHEYKQTDPRPTCAATTIVLRTLLQFLKWNKSDPDNIVRPIAEELAALNQRLDDAHEEYVRSLLEEA